MLPTNINADKPTEFTLSAHTKLPKDSLLKFEPVEVSHFSTDSNLEQHFEDDRSLRFFNPPRLKKQGRPIHNLAVGYKNFKQFSYDRSKPRNSSLLSCVMNLEKRNGAKIDVDFITNRGNLLHIINLIKADTSEAFEYNVLKYDGQIFISDTDYRDKQVMANVGHQKAVYGGYRFEQVVTSSAYKKRLPQDYERAKNNYETFKLILQLELGKHKVLFRSETDCAFKPRSESKELSNFTELKTAINQPKNPRNYHNKLFKTYYQCKISGIEKYIIGFRGPKFDLLTVKQFEVSDTEIPDTLTRGEDWLNHVMNWISKTLMNEGGEYWKLIHEKGGQLRLIKIEDESIQKAMFQNGIGVEFDKHRKQMLYNLAENAEKGDKSNSDTISDALNDLRI